MPEVIRRRREGVSGGARFNVRTSEAAAAAIRAAAKAEGFENPTIWAREQLEKAAGYLAPVEETPAVPWEVAEGGEEAPATPSAQLDVGPPAAFDGTGDLVGPAPNRSTPPPKKPGRPKGKKASKKVVHRDTKPAKPPRAAPSAPALPTVAPAPTLAGVADLARGWLLSRLAR